MLCRLYTIRARRRRRRSCNARVEQTRSRGIRFSAPDGGGGDGCNDLLRLSYRRILLFILSYCIIMLSVSSKSSGNARCTAFERTRIVDQSICKLLQNISADRCAYRPRCIFWLVYAYIYTTLKYHRNLKRRCQTPTALLYCQPLSLWLQQDYTCVQGKNTCHQWVDNSNYDGGCYTRVT